VRPSSAPVDEVSDSLAAEVSYAGLREVHAATASTDPVSHTPRPASSHSGRARTRSDDHDTGRAPTPSHSEALQPATAASGPLRRRVQIIDIIHIFKITSNGSVFATGQVTMMLRTAVTASLLAVTLTPAAGCWTTHADTPVI